MATDGVAAQFEEKVALVLARRWQPKIAGHVLQELHRAEQRIEHIGKRYVRPLRICRRQRTSTVFPVPTSPVRTTNPLRRFTP